MRNTPDARHGLAAEDRVGSVIERGGKHRVYSNNGEFIGTYMTLAEAMVPEVRMAG
jgi:hypothetical protein